MAGLLLWLIALVVMIVAAQLVHARLRQEDLGRLPCRLKRALVSPPERRLFDALCRAAGDRLYVCPKVRPADVLDVPSGTTLWYARFNRIAMKHLDFVLCSRATLSPVLAIELDDRSHERSARRARDAVVHAALRAVDLPLERVPVRDASRTDERQDMIRRRVLPAAIAAASPIEARGERRPGMLEWRETTDV